MMLNIYAFSIFNIISYINSIGNILPLQGSFCICRVISFLPKGWAIVRVKGQAQDQARDLASLGGVIPTHPRTMVTQIKQALLQSHLQSTSVKVEGWKHNSVL